MYTIPLGYPEEVATGKPSVEYPELASGTELLEAVKEKSPAQSPGWGNRVVEVPFPLASVVTEAVLMHGGPSYLPL
jgi:hypothetical protein